MTATATELESVSPVKPETTSLPAVRNAVVTWFEILAADFERAVRFYEAAFGVELRRDPAWPNMAIFPYQAPAVGGAVVQAKDAQPADGGVTVYLNCDGKLDAVLERATVSGGAVLEAKNHIPNVGWVAQIRDSEGNRVGLHAVV
jgi:predicted enzyme related to lactoylglutathione lyase